MDLPPLSIKGADKQATGKERRPGASREKQNTEYIWDSNVPFYFSKWMRKIGFTLPGILETRQTIASSAVC